MTKKIIQLGAALSFAMAGLLPAAPAMAHQRGGYDQAQYEDADRYYARRGYDDRDYGRDYRDGTEYRAHRDYRGQRDYARRSARTRCGKGTTGLILGGVVGGLLGRSVAGYHGDRTAGLIIGGGAGALAGRAIDRSDDRCRRR